MKHAMQEERYEEPFTLDGKTHMIPKTREIKVPALPRDFDATVLGGVTRVTCLVVAAAMVWSTVSIGSMLSEVAPTWTAYMIAGVFDLSWITALAVEWLSRYQPKKAKFPKAVGWGALAVSIAAIFAHGLLEHQPVAGAVGAVISAVAKVMWMLVMRHTAKALTPDQQAWVDAEMSEANALLAVTVARRQVARVRARAADELAALEFGRTTNYEVRQAAPGPETSEAESESLRRAPETSGEELEAADAAPATTGPEALRRPSGDAREEVGRASEAAGDGRPLAKLVRDLLRDGVKPDLMVAEVLKIRPDAKPDSIRRTCSTELRTGHYL